MCLPTSYRFAVCFAAFLGSVALAHSSIATYCCVSLLQVRRPELTSLSCAHACRRPGILVLINDTDWELTGQLQTIVEDGDTVTFISTLHGG